LLAGYCYLAVRAAIEDCGTVYWAYENLAVDAVGDLDFGCVVYEEYTTVCEIAKGEALSALG